MRDFTDTGQRTRLPAVLWDALRALKLAPRAVLRHAGLPVTLLSDDMAFVDTHGLFALWAAVDELSDDPAVGIRIAVETRTEQHMLAFLAATYAPDFRDGLLRLARFKRLCSTDRLEIEERGGLVHLTSLWPAGVPPEPASLTDASLAAMVELGRRGTRRQLTPRSVQYRRSGPFTQTHRDFFRCPIQSSAPSNRITFDAADLDIPFPGHNAEMLALLTPGLSMALREIEEPIGITQEVRATVSRALASGRPDAGDVARSMGMSKRTLQRRISEAGTTFREIVEDTRRDLALDLLSDHKVDIAEIAYLLGYDSPNSFYRAFRAQKGTTPGQWRRKAPGEAD